ncbi:DUF1738 domain-containing protein [bacterium]|nr:DUF1738 domain-containing protein [bacterium]
MTNYFENVKTTDEIKSRYKELVKKYHPDIYGDEGNEILKEIHNQLERVLKNGDKGYFQQTSDVKDTDDIRNLKKELVKEALRYTFPEGALLALYWENHIRPCNHKNPLSEHEFSGWNIWSLEISMVINDFHSSDWSTFAQYREAKNFVDKGQKGTRLTLAVYGKEKDENGEETEELKFYKGYSVFNFEQTKAVKNNDDTTKLATNNKPQLSVAS